MRHFSLVLKKIRDRSVAFFILPYSSKKFVKMMYEKKEFLCDDAQAAHQKQTTAIPNTYEDKNCDSNTRCFPPLASKLKKRSENICKTLWW